MKEMNALRKPKIRVYMRASTSPPETEREIQRYLNKKGVKIESQGTQGEGNGFIEPRQWLKGREIVRKI